MPKVTQLLYTIRSLREYQERMCSSPFPRNTTCEVLQRHVLKWMLQALESPPALLVRGGVVAVRDVRLLSDASSVQVEDRVAVVAPNVVSVPVAIQCQVPDHHQPVPALARCAILRRHLRKVLEVHLELYAMVGSMVHVRVRVLEVHQNVLLRPHSRCASSSKLVG